MTVTSLDEYPACGPTEELGDIGERDHGVEPKLADAHGACELNEDARESPFIEG